LRFLTRDEYNHLVKISHDFNLKSGAESDNIP